MHSLEQEAGAWDSVLLEPFSEDTFVTNLQQRFKKDHIYTYIGNVLISVNPYRKLALYSTDLAETYISREPFQLPPHIYAVAASSYRWLNDQNEDQGIIITGESGAGKTEAARIVLQFLVLISSDEREVKLIKDKLVQANTLLEAFGNAKTMRNDNASRFGKFLDLEFNFKGDPVGAHIMHYKDNEFDFKRSKLSHILSVTFRCRHSTTKLLTRSRDQLTIVESLKLKRNVEHYSCLLTDERQATQVEEEDKNLFTYTKTALETLGFGVDDVIHIFRILSVVLKLGNLQFVPSNNIDGTEGCSINNDYELYEVCELLEMEQKFLKRVLITRCLDGGIVTDMNASYASRTRDVLCKTLYSRLFTWLVNKINESLKAKSFGKRRTLGVLDFYGFEVFNKNNFEQLVINYCNEKIHQFITATTLKDEQEELIKEGLEWTRIEFFNNHSICHLLDNEKYGLLSLLDEPHVQNDTFYFTRIEQCCAGHSHCLTTDTNLPPLTFQIRHYAGTVTYSVKGMVEKNRDFLPREVSRALYNCDHPLMHELFPEGNPKRCASKRPLSKTAHLQIALKSLLSTLKSRQIRYIRCLKPNELKQPRLFELALIQHQTRYLNLVPIVQLWRCGYCSRMPFGHFLNRYKMLGVHTWPKWRGSPIEGVSILVRSLPIPSAEFAFGRSKIFVRSPRTVYELEDFRRTRLHDLALLIQKTWKGHRCSSRYRKMRHSQKIIAFAWKSWRECKLGIPFDGRKHLWCLYRVAREEYRILKDKQLKEWAVKVIQRRYIEWKRKQFLLKLTQVLHENLSSPICKEWPNCSMRLMESSLLLRKLHHQWRCHKYRSSFDQTARNRMREKVTASFIFKDRKCSYPRSVSHPFLGDYVRLRQNVQWKKMCVETNDQYVVFADIINKIARSSGKFVPILLAISTRSMLILDQRTLQIKYRIPATEVYRISLSPFLDDVAVVHIRALSTGGETESTSSEVTGCLFQSDLSKKKGDFVFQTGHVIEVVTKLFLVVQNATGKSPEINIATEFEANFGSQTVLFSFKCMGLPEIQSGQLRVVRKGNKMEVLV